MNYMYSVKEEYLEPLSSPFPPPQPIEGLHEIRPQPFLTKTFDVVNDQSTNHIVSWSKGGTSFVVWDPHAFSNALLPKYFKHNNFSSFVRQLNTYGFRKIDPNRWEFANEGFLRGQRHLLRNIRRKKGPSQPIPNHNSQQGQGHCIDIEVGCFGLDAEIDRLRQEKHVLMMELMSLRQKQYNTTLYLLEMEQRLQGIEINQKQMMAFLARAIKNPVFIHQLLQQKVEKKELEEAMNMTKKRKLVEQGTRLGTGQSSSVKVEPLELGDCEFEGSELEMQVFERGEMDKEEVDEALESQERIERLLGDEGFWEELMFSLKFEGRFDIPTPEYNAENADDSSEPLNQEFRINSFHSVH
ncbi:heat stress transcription factor a-6b-like protein [Trifolium pratense]|uniref:Heat stress transcription factor a-6b-like protein n=1 Tax=Trifolium pratense TaxID=57577 RepID=A0A2K3LE60_TRIPR|nr:heat stress transcription factor a-6b-like protein [Trifolium pratense]